MISRLLGITILGLMLSGCYMVPLALVGPATTGFTTGSILQASVSTTAGILVKKSTGKTISEHAFDALSKELLQQSYFPKKFEIVAP